MDGAVHGRTVPIWATGVLFAVVNAKSCRVMSRICIWRASGRKINRHSVHIGKLTNEVIIRLRSG
jgi:hypothetical protein